MSTAATRKRYAALDRFDVLGELGRGAGSRILHIRDPLSLQHFAMKVVVRDGRDDQKFLDQAKHEFEVAQKLDHPALIRVYDIRVMRRWFREHEVRTLLEYVHGQTLEQIKSPAVPLLLAVFAEVAAGVSHMHGRDVFHADLKPNNIMVSQSGRVKVIDFGLAWFRGQQKFRVQGTMSYLAPEQVHNRVVTEATDIYNFGVTMHRMLTGSSRSVPPTGGNFIFSQGVLAPARELNPDVPPALSDLVGRCCEAKPEKRPENMAAVADALGKIMASLKVTVEDLQELLQQQQRR
jgi:serine/threonine-protein kinase